jgi:hypothetical protein
MSKNRATIPSGGVSKEKPGRKAGPAIIIPRFFPFPPAFFKAGLTFHTILFRVYTKV